MSKSHTKTITCPFCFKKHNLSPSSLECPDKGYKIPEEFLENEPLWLVTVGFTRHGKTVFLTALTLALQEIGAVWDGVTFDYLDIETKTAVHIMRYDAMVDIKMPDANAPEKLDRPLLMLKLGSLPGIGTRNAVIYDVAGEIFNRDDEIHEYVPALKHVRTIWFFISLTDLYAQTTIDTMADLFGAYRRGMRKLGAELKGRTMIVVYTKADTRNFSPPIDAYLRDDPLSELTNRNADRLPTTDDFDWTTYTDGLKAMSQELRVYTERQLRGGRQFISNAESEGMRVEFCLTSALGTNPDPKTNKMREDATRYRVLDPFIWAVLVEKEEEGKNGKDPNQVKRRVTLVIESSSSSEIYEANLPVQLGQLLEADDIEVQTYYLGQSKLVTRWGQTPPEVPARYPRPQLIGPILEQLPVSAGKVVILANKLPYDLNDFRTTEWKERTLIVTSEELDTDWEQFTYRNPNDLPPLLTTIKYLNND